MGVTDREKVIKGLELCTNSGITYCGDCEAMDDCPYYAGEDGCMTPLMRDALALLKEQEPRVLKPEEMSDWDGAFLLEDRFGKPELVWVSFYAEYDLYGNSNVRLLNLDGGVYDKSTLLYGYEWRCWSGRPTEEQLKAEEWDD